jgi:repressor of nif and glnA expression
MTEPKNSGEILANLKPGEWYDFNDGKQYLHSISLIKIEGIVKICLLLVDLNNKISTLVFPATVNPVNAIYFKNVVGKNIPFS